MFGINTGIKGGLSGCVSSLWDRLVSAVQTVIDTVKAKLVELWTGNPLVAAVMSVVAIVVGIVVVMFFPAVAGVIRAIGSGILKIFAKLAEIVTGLINKLLGAVGRKLHE